MTRINVRTLADARDGSRLLDATITATATRARVDGPALTLPEPVTVRLKRGELSSPLILAEPDGTWAWQLSVRPTGARLMDALTLLCTFAGEEVDWADLTPVDPATLAPLNPVPPSAAQVLLRAEEAVTEAEAVLEEATDVLGVANTAVVSGTVSGDDLVLTQKDGGTINAGNVRGLPGAGVPWGVGLATTEDLNNVTAMGVYRQSSTAAPTTALNYPADGMSGVLEVFHVINTQTLLQRYTPHGGSSYVRGIWIRRRVSGTWGSWVFTGTSRTDRTAGLAMYSWDDVIQREQLVYGDTGWRQMTSLLLNGWTGTTFALRRIGRDVIVRGYYLNPDAATSDTVVDLPLGFRRGIVSFNIPIQRSNTAMTYLALSASAAAIPRAGGIVGSSVGWEARWVTDDAWPTSLPGSAIGTIPSL